MNYYSIIRFKKRSPPWTKPVFHLSLCFVFGFLTGFTHPPSSLPTSPSIQLISYQETTPDLNILQPKIPPPPPPPPPPLPAGNSSTRLLIVITTTRSNDRPLHGALLGRLACTLRLVPPPLLWIVVEPHDGAPETAGVLRRTGILYRHLTYNKGKGNFTDLEAEEHHQRNVALGHVEHHRINGIVHFAGVSNVYDLGFFQEIRRIVVFGAWPVAMVSPGGRTEVMIKGPVCNSSQVVGWFTKDMVSAATYKWTSTTSSPAVIVWGFAFNSSMLWDPERWGRHTTFPDTSQDSMRFVHETILEDESKVMAIPSGCSQIMLWHLQIQSGSRQRQR